MSIRYFTRHKYAEEWCQKLHSQGREYAMVNVFDYEYEDDGETFKTDVFWVFSGSDRDKALTPVKLLSNLTLND